MEKTTDDQVAVSMVTESQARFPDLKSCSFDKGFHSPANQQDLKVYLDLVALSKKGRLNKQEKEREYAEDFQARYGIAAFKIWPRISKLRIS